MHACCAQMADFLAIYLYHLVGQGQEYCHSNKKLAHQLHQGKPIICCADTKGKPWRCVSLDSRHQLALLGKEVRNLILGSLPLLV